MILAVDFIICAGNEKVTGIFYIVSPKPCSR